MVPHPKAERALLSEGQRRDRRMGRGAGIQPVAAGVDTGAFLV